MAGRGVLGIWEGGLSIFTELGSYGNCFRDLGNKLIVLGFREPCKKGKINKSKTFHLKGKSILFDFFASGGGGGGGAAAPTGPTLLNVNIFTFVLTDSSGFDIGEKYANNSY